MYICICAMYMYISYIYVHTTFACAPHMKYILYRERKRSNIHILKTPAADHRRPPFHPHPPTTWMQAGRRKEVSALPNAWSKDVGWSSRRKSLQAGSDFRRELHLALACIGFGGGVMAGNAAENVPERYWNIMQNLLNLKSFWLHFGTWGPFGGQRVPGRKKDAKSG